MTVTDSVTTLTRPGLRSLVVGLGRAGAGLHLPVLAGLRGADRTGLFDPRPPVGCDPVVSDLPFDLPVVGTVETATALCDPQHTVVHLCTPPTERTDALARLARLGFRAILVEKPLATDPAALAEIIALRDRWDLRLMVVAHWQCSALTGRLLGLIRLAPLGPLREILVRQRKPRFHRSLTTHGHPSAFDVEAPHSVGLALQLAGPATLADAELADLCVGRTVLPGMGRAALTLRHVNGVRTRIVTELASPVRERRVVLRFARGVVTGHYPGSADDDHAQLRIGRRGTAFPDDALAAFLTVAYQRFQHWDEADSDFARSCRVVELLAEAKAWCAHG